MVVSTASMECVLDSGFARRSAVPVLYVVCCISHKPLILFDREDHLVILYKYLVYAFR